MDLLYARYARGGGGGGGITNFIEDKFQGFFKLSSFIFVLQDLYRCKGFNPRHTWSLLGANIII